jgi:hypothetical protein
VIEEKRTPNCLCMKEGKQVMKKLILFAIALVIASGSSVYAREHGKHRYSHQAHGYYGGAPGFYGGANGGAGSAEGRTSG